MATRLPDATSWYPDLPAGWRYSRLKYEVRYMNSGGTPKTDDDSFWTRDGSGLPWVSISDMSTVDVVKGTERQLTPAGLASKKLQIFKTGTLLYSMYASVGKVSALGIDAAINQAILAIEPNTTKCSHKYLRWALVYVTKRILEAASNSTQDNLNLQKVRDAFIVLPDIDQQDTIALFLDREIAEVDALVAEYERLIALLEEKRLAIITLAVTRGLDAGTQFKASGLELLKEIPTNWQIGQLRRFWKVTDCKHVTVAFADEGYPLASVREVQGFDLNLQFAKRTTSEWFSRMIGGGREPHRGDLIYCRNVSVGASAYVATDEKFALGQDVCLIRSKNENQRFLNYFMKSTTMKDQIGLIMIGATFNRINISKIESLVVPCPPRSDQDAIVEFLDDRMSEIDSQVKCVKSAVDLLAERRSALITAVVTGQFDIGSHMARQKAEAAT